MAILCCRSAMTRPFAGFARISASTRCPTIRGLRPMPRGLRTGTRRRRRLRRCWAGGQRPGPRAINLLGDVFAYPQIQARGVAHYMQNASGCAADVVTNPVRLLATPADYCLAPSRLGEHTDAIFADRLGPTPAAIAALHDQGIASEPMGPGPGSVGKVD
jgi:hypothetical protein